MKESVFQPFFYQRKDGTGLGLFMVQHAITEVHGERFGLTASWAKVQHFIFRFQRIKQSKKGVTSNLGISLGVKLL